MEKKKLKFSFNCPVILGFTAVCFAALVLDMVTGGWANHAFFSVYRSSLLNPLTYVRMFGHVVGHASWSHFSSNILMILVIGPLLEEKYGSLDILLVILVTALVTGLVHFIFFPQTALLGASGVVFAFILLSSFVNLKNGEIPITLILVALLYLGGEVYSGIFVQSNVSNLTHILGGITGSVLGFAANKDKLSKY